MKPTHGTVLNSAQVPIPCSSALWGAFTAALLLANSTSNVMATVDPPEDSRATLVQMPLHFEPASVPPGQPDCFRARGPACSVWVTPDGVQLRLPRAPTRDETAADDGSPSGAHPPERASSILVQLGLIGANPERCLTPIDELVAKANYFRGKDSAKWRRQVPLYARIRCDQAYPGIDLVYYGTSLGQLEYDFVVAPGADPGGIVLAVEGADRVNLDAQGDLVITTAGNRIHLRRPVIYQVLDGQRHDVGGGYQLRFAPNPQSPMPNPQPQISFQIGDYNPSLPLIIDPILDYASYLGGTGHDSARAIAVDTSGNAYIAGFTQSTDFPTADPLDGSLADNDAFVVKLHADGSGLAFATYFGGGNSDFVSGIAIDAGGNVYITGDTWSASDFPLVNPIQSQHKFGGTDAFVAKLNPEGNAIIYSTFLGGNGTDAGRGIAVDALGRAGVAGITSSTDFPVTTGGIQETLAGAYDVFVTKLSADGSSFVYSSYLGGSGDEFSYELPKIAMDPAGHACVTGLSGSTNFPTTSGAIQPHFGGGANDLFVSKLSLDGTTLAYSTHLGGADWDAGSGSVALDTAGCAYVVNFSASPDFPLVPAPFSHTPNYPDLFTREGWVYAAKLSADGSKLDYSVRLPGGHWPGGLAVDGAGHAWIVGNVSGPSTGWSFPAVNPIQAGYGGGDLDATLLKLSPDADALLFASCFGGSGRDTALAVATGPDGSVYVVGETTSTNLMTADGLQPAFAGTADAFVLKLSDPDTNAPAILAVGNYGASNVVTIDFSEALDPAPATNATNYTLDQGATITSAAFGVNSRTIRLTTSALTPGTHYTLSVSHVADRASASNAIPANTTVAFTAMNLYRGFVRQENYAGLEPAGSLGALTSHATFPHQPDAVNMIHELEIPPNAYYQDGIRLSGWLLPPVTGEYTFYLCNISQADLHLSRNESPFNKLRIAFEPVGFAGGDGGPRAWNHVTPGWNSSPQPGVSLPIHLEADRPYYLEVRATASAANMLGVAWQMPGQPPPRDGDPPIPGAYLTQLADRTTATVTITEQPASVVTAEGQSAAFSVKAAASEPRLFYQWRKRGLDIPGANASSLFLTELALSDNGSVFDCVVTVPGATVTSQSATLTVTPDTIPPTLLSAEGNVSNDHLTLSFSEPVRLEDATNTTHYVVSDGLTVSLAALLADRRTVVLTTSSQTPGASYTVAVSGIRDRSTVGNPVDANATASFFGWADEVFVGPFPSWANVKDDYGAAGDGVADDTDAIQQALNEVATAGHATILHFPAGTYRITRTLEFVARLSASLVGEDPLTTIIRWDGPTDGTMLFANGVAYSRWSRLTWDGGGTALIAVRHGHTGVGPQVTQNQHSDEVFRDLGAGLIVDPVNGGDTHLILRCHFLRCSIQGIAVSSYNAIDWHIWDSVFEDCKYGVRAYTGNFHVYRSLFVRSSEMDILAGLLYTGIRGNLSLSSKTFVNNNQSGHSVTIQGNTIVDSLDPAPIRWPTGDGVLLLDNTVVTDPGATAAPVVEIENNLVSVGNIFTTTNPIAVGGRAAQLGDRTASRDSFSPPPAMIPRFLPRSTSPVIEVPRGANAATIQEAMDTAATLNGQRPIVHLPSGQFFLDRTLVVPPNCDLQLVGDGYSGHATTLIGPNTTGVPAIFLAGPSRATLRDFHVLGSGAGVQSALGSGIALENCDQPGSRVFLEQVIIWLSLTNNLVVNRLKHLDVSAHDLVHGDAQSVSVRVIGSGVSPAAGTTVARVVIFGGGVGGGRSAYQVEHGGRLMAQDIWFEGGPGLFRLTDSGTFTLNNAKTAPFNADRSIHGGNQALTLDGFRGQVSLLNHHFTETALQVYGDGSSTDLLLLGCGGFPFPTVPPLPKCINNQSPEARAEYWFSSANGLQTPHATEPDPVFLLKMLEQVRTETPRRLVPLPKGVTDVRIYRVSVESCKYGMILSGSNAPPALPALPTQYGHEGSPLFITNLVTGPDAPYGLYAFTFGATTPTGMTMDPDSGVIQWTPTEAQSPSTNEIPVIVTAHSSPLLKATNVVTILIREANQPPVLLPDREFVGTDIGKPPYPGRTAANPDGSIEVTASGAGTYWGDDFHFSHEQVEGDFDVGVQISGMEGGTTGAAAGLMTRVSLDAESPFVQLTMNPPGGYAWYPAYRLVSGEPPALWQGSAGGGGRYPTWLRLQRQGRTFRALIKYADTDWQLVNQLVLPTPFPNRLYLGLCTWSWAAGQDPGNPPPQVLVTYRDYRHFPVEYSHAIVDRSVEEGESVVFQALARDADVPSLLTFSLDAGAPEGAAIHPSSGIFTWTPSEAQGPGTHPITLRVTDNGEPPLTDALTFTVTVHEVNAAPVLAAIGDQTIEELQSLELTLLANDPFDIPPNTVTLSAGVMPAGAAFDSGTGLFSWIPSEIQGPGTYLVTFWASDDGIPSRSDAESITITVIEPPRPVTLSSFEVRDGQFRFTFAAQPGKSYLVQAKNRLDDPVWIDLQEIPASQSLVEFTAPLSGSGARYYRVITSD